MVEPSVTIRQASTADAALLAEIGARTFFDTFAADNTPEDMNSYLTSSFSPAIQAAELAEPEAILLIAEMDREVAGYAKLRTGGDAPSCVTGNNSVEIVRFYVDKKHQGCGVGAALMGECVSAAKSVGAHCVWLGVWERNDRALAFYRKWGFRKVGTQPFMLGTDRQTDILMERPI